jgi:hypothetical protein
MVPPAIFTGCVKSYIAGSGVAEIRFPQEMIHVRLHASVPGHDLRQTVGKSRFFGQLYQLDGAIRDVPPIAIVQKITHWPDAFVHPFVQDGLKVLRRV